MRSVECLEFEGGEVHRRLLPGNSSQDVYGMPGGDLSFPHPMSRFEILLNLENWILDLACQSWREICAVGIVDLRRSWEKDPRESEGIRGE
jgi:hypothetical protein